MRCGFNCWFQICLNASVTFNNTYKPVFCYFFSDLVQFLIISALYVAAFCHRHLPSIFITYRLTVSDFGDIITIISIIILSPVTDLLSPLPLVFNQQLSPSLTAQVSLCSTFSIMCHVTSTAVFWIECISCSSFQWPNVCFFSI